jgi:hypothetical protein
MTLVKKKKITGQVIGSALTHLGGRGGNGSPRLPLVISSVFSFAGTSRGQFKPLQE